MERKYNPKDFPEPVCSDMESLYSAIEKNEDETVLYIIATRLFYSLKHMGVFGVRSWSEVREMQEYFGVYMQ